MKRIEKATDAKICLTAAGILVHRGKVLLVKHKKLGVWLSPGGHIEPNEHPHQAAEREFWEETGVKVTALADLTAPKLPLDDQSTYVPNPILTNIHWINYQAYLDRLAAKKPISQADACEIHSSMLFLVKPTGSLEYRQNIEETDGIAWFSPEEVDDLETFENIKQELRYVFELV